VTTKKSLLLFTMAGFILAVFVTNIMGEYLISYYENEDGTVYSYDQESIKKNTEIVKVWTDWRYNKKNKDWSGLVKFCNEFTGNTADTCNKYSYEKLLHEINCKDGKSRFDTTVLYDRDGNVIYSNSTPSGWEDIVPNSTEEGLKNRVCK